MNYITLKDMGSSGGMCSQLTIFSGLSAVAKANNLTIAFSEDMIKGKDIIYPHTGETFTNSLRLFDLLELKYEIKPNEFFKDFKDKHINYHTTTYDETLFNLDEGFNYNLVGRFDLYTYWYNDIKDEVESWSYKPQIQDQADIKFKEIKHTFGNDNPIISIHMRRGDYLLPEFSFCELGIEYYTKAIVENFMPYNEYNFICFSNDIEYSKSILDGHNIYFVEPKGGEKVCTDSEKEDLALLSLCDHHIISNSSYPWWGAFLSKNKNKKIVCPTNYVKPDHPSSWINGNYYPPNWINIDN
jgi:hypothetical protein|tara:strand:- start:292 stop:1188 length:897 start_codon:yes stop_codon:yes gene_type:complete